jgi:hypothetical protein
VHESSSLSEGSLLGQKQPLIRTFSIVEEHFSITCWTVILSVVRIIFCYFEGQFLIVKLPQNSVPSAEIDDFEGSESCLGAQERGAFIKNF